MSVGGRSMLRVTGRLTSYFDPTGLAAARTDVRAWRVVMMPALAIETVCCSFLKVEKESQALRTGKKKVYVVVFRSYHNFV